MNKAVIIKAVLLSAALAIGCGAQAKATDTTTQQKGNGKGNNGNSGNNGNGGSIGNTTVYDATLAYSTATALAYSGANPMQGTSGFASTSAFSKSGTGTWSALATVGDDGKLKDSSSLFNFTFTEAGNGKSGTWTITNTSATLSATLDLALAIHASNASTAFLFDNTTVAAGETLSGNWNIAWLNNGGQVPGFSNAVLFARDLTTVTQSISPVPEPATLPMLGAGLALLGAATWRKRKNNTNNN